MLETVVALAGMVAAAFVVGYSTRRMWVAALPAAVPVALGLLTVIAKAGEDRSRCYEECGSDWLAVFALVSGGAAIALAVGVALGVVAATARRGDDGRLPSLPA